MKDLVASRCRFQSTVRTDLINLCSYKSEENLKSAKILAYKTLKSKSIILPRFASLITTHRTKSQTVNNYFINV